MKINWPVVAVGRDAQRKLAGAAAALAIASIVYSQFDLYGHFSRDSAIYLYGGQRMTHGVPPYASIMDPKGPITSILCGFGVAVARLLGRDDVLTVRVEFCALAIISVLGIYLLVLELWESVVAAVVAATVFVIFRNFAHQALMGPEGHAPGVVFLIFAMWLTVRRQWYWAGVAASLAFCSWQPLATWPIVVVLCAVVWSAGTRLRALGWTLAGLATPLAALMIYYAAEGHLGSLFTGLFVFPLTSVRRPPETLASRLAYVVRNIDSSFQSSAVFIWVGLALMVLMTVVAVVSARPQWRSALTSPIVLLVLLTFVLHLFYVAYDYIGWTHAFPLLPYAAIGFGAATAYVLDRLARPQIRRIVTGALLAGSAVLTVVYAVAYYEPSSNGLTIPNRLAGGGGPVLRAEEAASCAIQRGIVAHTPLWVLGDPVPLVLLHRVNPDNYPYEGSGLDQWRVDHTPGGFAGWSSQITASHASVVVLDDWRGPYVSSMKHFLTTHGYRPGYVGTYRVYVTPAAHARLHDHSIKLAHKQYYWPLTTTDGESFRDTHCTRIAAG